MNIHDYRRKIDVKDKVDVVMSENRVKYAVISSPEGHRRPRRKR